ncbi:MAG: tRNA 4-thiouridine(8) synthase ThiI [Lachnospiraceae bacterium]|nr:tRNA 4-thiouridine(8) synthase ThiI [Lachnospiraceae bacterium]
MKYRALLIKYAEIGIKGQNRYVFEDALCDRIRGKLKNVAEGFVCTREQGRILVECPEEYDYDDAIAAIKTVFGVWAICPAIVIDDAPWEASTRNTDEFAAERLWESLTKHTGDFVEERFKGESFTFKVFARRADKRFPIETPDICSRMGDYLLERFPQLKVDVHDPQVKLQVEIRNKAYVFCDTIPGLGGMPVGANGRAMLLLSGGIDSPVAGYMIAKRGVYIDAVYFHAPPYTSERAKQKVIDLAKLISVYTGPIRLHIVNFTDIQLMIIDKCPREELTIIMRRYMMRIAEVFAQKRRALGLVTGESIGQVASQTMQGLAATNAVCTMPVYRPLIAFDKQDIVDIALKINTYETSIEPYEDCCTIFVAKHPKTKPRIDIIERSEKKLEGVIEELVEKAIETVEIVDISENS